MHEQGTPNPDSKRRKLASPTLPTPTQLAPQPERQMGYVKDLSQAINRLTNHTLYLKEKVKCIDGIDGDVDALLQSVNNLDDNDEAINAKVDLIGDEVAYATKEIRNTHNEISKLKDLVENMDVQWEQERELRRMREADEQQCFKAMMANVDALVAHFIGHEP
ncbi:hypothetical protein GSI_09466 [Ganoderma sinense ZZ0214-1]|uniref:Uncharacterized protein n=1 Tax=Ganoderma sinense ZZ0214-1 TaxID=1077348 RepID=A0A2G8S6P7_9APHY|nr:hypothetical protein GSI_09466 [Ganoderma sinense ZZ0214-1]